jgi:hypothetical protein
VVRVIRRGECEGLDSVRMFRGEHVRLRVWAEGGWPLFGCMCIAVGR